MKTFFDMGGYALYVWSSYALALVLLLGNYVAARVHRKKILQDLISRLRREKNS